MKLFSERFGYKPKVVPDPESLSQAQIVRLLNITMRHLETNYSQYNMTASWSDSSSIMEQLMNDLADRVLQIPYCRQHNSERSNLELVENAFSTLKWYQIYDLLSIVIHWSYDHLGLSESINEVLREECAGFVWHEGEFVPMITTHQADEISSKK